MSLLKRLFLSSNTQQIDKKTVFGVRGCYTILEKSNLSILYLMPLDSFVYLKNSSNLKADYTLVNPWPFSVKVTTACKVNFHTVKFLKKVLKDSLLRYISRYIVDSSRGGGLVSQHL